MSSDARAEADAPLRRDVRLLGDVLGKVLVEQEGDELLEAEERIRLRSRDARETGDAGAVRDTVRMLSPVKGSTTKIPVLLRSALFGGTMASTNLTLLQD